MSWSRVAWIEGDVEYEQTVPHNWVKGKHIYWPNQMNVKRAYFDHEEPNENWLAFKLVKVKLHKGRYLIIFYIYIYIELCIIILNISVRQIRFDINSQLNL